MPNTFPYSENNPFPLHMESLGIYRMMERSWVSSSQPENFLKMSKHWKENPVIHKKKESSNVQNISSWSEENPVLYEDMESSNV